MDTKPSVYKFSANRPESSHPHPSGDLVSLYGLNSLASSVARTDPVTGEKRKLRKSFKGKLNKFELPGRWEPLKTESSRPGGLLNLLDWPEEEWHIQKVSGKELQPTFSPSVLAKLDEAVKMEPGLIPGFDETTLGLDIPVIPPPKRSPLPKMEAPTYEESEPVRPRRQGRKRRYDEGSFEGYEEFDGYSSEDDRKKKRRRKTDDYIDSPPLQEERGGAYGAHLSSHGSGISAHVR